MASDMFGIVGRGKAINPISYLDRVKKITPTKLMNQSRKKMTKFIIIIRTLTI